MNAEQLNGILWKLAEAHGELNTMKRLNAVRSALEHLSNEPQNADRQNQLRDQVTNFTNVVLNPRINVFSVREDGLIDDLELRDLVGEELHRNVLDAMAGQEGLTPRVAFDKVNLITETTNARLAHIRQISQGLTDLGIGYGEPDAGTVELGLFVPRPANDLPFAEVLAEGEELNELISLGYQVVHGSPHSPPVRYLTSSDYGFLLDVDPAVVAFIVLALERTLAFYKNYLEVKKLHGDLAERGAAPKLLEQLEADAVKDRDEKVHAAILEAIGERPELPKERKNELANHLVAKIQIFLRKSEHGNYIDVRVGDNDEIEPARDDETPADKAAREALQTHAALLDHVRELARRLHVLEKRRDPAKLPPPTRPNTPQ